MLRLLSSNGKKLQTLPLEYEDSFCIETFSDLIDQHRRANKQFILARVQTLDEKGNEYSSFYSAFELNKILFQTQLYNKQKLIHRMQVLNPLTNTDIIGPVLYFAVDAPLNEPPSPTVQEANEGTVHNWTLASPLVAIDGKIQNVQKINVTSPTRFGSPVKLKTVTVKESNDSQNQIDAVLFASDTDFLEKSAIRARFRQNALEEFKLFELPEYFMEVPEIHTPTLKKYVLAILGAVIIITVVSMILIKR